MKQDLRFEKTEKAIQTAFLSLLQQKELAKISVKELCDVAEISRNAFYQHYETKEHLYESMLQAIVMSIEEGCKPLIKDLSTITEAEERLFLDNILLAVNHHRFAIYQLLTSQPGQFSKAFHEMLVQAMHQSSEQIAVIPDALFIHIFAGGIVAFVSYWLLETSYSLEEAQEKLFAVLGQLKVVNG
ncbi:TetR/AcrR family transcriptional regulator [Aerococcaceae bacterium zg-BR9]|uniref:TetR/AcrR family transcriptional regulator n=1 Tax=Aerococcaceae bacterium zg-1292 TaxID=2774330 RepID=UPI0040644E00|nr:TetR/AcrR family transcriptional regulator [Aerococcaceae bacterium zg-BR9]MBF6977577.1 TetR/AcrR family transcriptional regulator [Aerococcaceae bacterium zg-BR22]